MMLFCIVLGVVCGCLHMFCNLETTITIAQPARIIPVTKSRSSLLLCPSWEQRYRETLNQDDDPTRLSAASKPHCKYKYAHLTGSRGREFGWARAEG